MSEPDRFPAVRQAEGGDLVSFSSVRTTREADNLSNDIH
jgi:hypothetical protein